MSHTRSRAGKALGAAGLLLFILLSVAPIAAGLGYALVYSLGLTGLLNEGLTTSHWRAVAGSQPFWASVIWSLYISAGTVAATVASAMALTLALARRLDLRPIPPAFYVPLTLPATVSAFLVFHALSAGGPVARMVARLSAIAEPSSFPSPVHDEFGIGIVLALLIVTIPFFLILFLQIYQNERLEEMNLLATSLGAGWLARATRVDVPILLLRARTNIVLLFIAVLGAYEIPLLLGRQSPEMLSVFTLRKLAHFDLTARSEAYIAALLFAVLVVSLLLPLVKNLRADEGS